MSPPSVAESRSAPTPAEVAGVGSARTLAACCRAARRAWSFPVRNTVDSSGLGLRPATGSSDAAPLEGCARVPSSAIERAWVSPSLRFDFVKQPRGVKFTDGTLMSSWVSGKRDHFACVSLAVGDFERSDRSNKTDARRHF